MMLLSSFDMTMPVAISMSRSSSATFSLPYADESSVRLFCVTFRPHDKILLFPPTLQTGTLLRKAVEDGNWGIDSQETALDCYTLNLTGSPFLKHARRESALLMKFLCCTILDRFKENGWDLIVCADLSCKTDLTAWYFARSAPRASLPHLHQRAGVDDDASDSGSASGSIAGGLDRKMSSVESNPPSLVCVSLSKTRKLQLINAPLLLQRVLKRVVLATYAPGLNADSQRGRHYELKLNGSPWETTNREQLTAACRMLSSIFAEFNARGYAFYGLVNFKETADSIFFERGSSSASRRPSAVTTGDSNSPAGGAARFMIMIMDGSNVLRLVGVQRSTADAVEKAIAKYWDAGLASKPSILDESEANKACSNGNDLENDVQLRHPHHLDGVTVDYVLKGSPWLARLSKIGKTRQFLASMLDVLLDCGWTVVTGLDISRGLNCKSALLFESCAPSSGLKHACISPLGKQSLQLLRGPPSLRRLIQNEFQRIILAEKSLNDGPGDGPASDFTFEAKLNGFHWDPHPEKDATEYVYTRKQMGALLMRLMDAGWRVVVSADVGHHQEDTDVGEGIHSWFLVFVGNASDGAQSMSHQLVDRTGSGGSSSSDGAHSVMNVSSRMGRRASAYAAISAAAAVEHQRPARHSTTIAPTVKALHSSPISNVRRQRR